MSISINLAIGNRWCQIGLYPFSWVVFAQRGHQTNCGFGPFRLMFN